MVRPESLHNICRVTRFCVRIHHAGYSFAQLRELWQTADTLGFDGASLYDVLAPAAFEVWTMLTVLAVHTQRLVAIPLVLDVGHRHPSVLAKMASSLDQLSGGNRLIVGLGYGGNPGAHHAYGFDWPPRVADRAARLEEYVVVLRALWSCSPSPSGATFAGNWYQLRDAAGFPVSTTGGPPILVASRGPRYGLRGVARVADLANVSFDLGPDEWREYQSVIGKHAADAGRSHPVGLTHNATVAIGRTRAEAEAKFERLAQSRNLTREQARRGLANALVGTPEDIVQRLLTYRGVGVDLAWVFLLFSDLPNLESIRLFAEEVLPAYRAHQ
jgi:alkanesulfonate monooxygenase SsuD/methylene tetrahydromethanopterin reductase-like flavin-dependent oxidoreductase (luciferase family)